VNVVLDGRTNRGPIVLMERTILATLLRAKLAESLLEREH
jgi:hypothetical protein